MHHALYIMHHASCIMYHASCIMHHASSGKHHASCIMDHASCMAQRRRPQKWRQPQKWRWPQFKSWAMPHSGLKINKIIRSGPKKRRRPQKWKSALPSNFFVIFTPLTSPWKITWIFSWWLLTVTATPQLMLNRKWYQASKLEMDFHMINIIPAALPMRAQREKDNI